MNIQRDKPIDSVVGDSIECMWMLSMHCEMSLIQEHFSCTVGATKWMQCFTFDLLSTIILKSRFPELMASFTLKLLRNVRCDKTSGSTEEEKMKFILCFENKIQILLFGLV